MVLLHLLLLPSLLECVYMWLCICGNGGRVATAPVALVAPEIPPLLMQRLAITESRSFSDISSRLPLLIPFNLSVLVSNLAIAIATALCNNLVALASTRLVR